MSALVVPVAGYSTLSALVSLTRAPTVEPTVSTYVVNSPVDDERRSLSSDREATRVPTATSSLWPGEPQKCCHMRYQLPRNAWELRSPVARRYRRHRGSAEQRHLEAAADRDAGL